MIRRQRSGDDATAKRLGFVLMSFGCIVAALLTHCVIDLLGDVMLAHDSYDDLAHESRQTGAIALGICLLVTLGFGLRAALLEARGNEGALLKLLRRAQPGCPRRHFMTVGVSALLLVAAMEACDAAATGRSCYGIVDLFGGSLLLAATVAAAVSALVTVSLRAGLRRLTQLHGALIAVARAIVRVAITRRSVSTFDRRNVRDSYGRPEMLGSRAAGRAPPGFPSLVSS